VHDGTKRLVPAEVLQNGTAEQFTLLGTEVWDLLECFSMAGHPVQLQ
jgi:hypothetical protein